MKDKVKVLGFAGLIVISIVAISAAVSVCHDTYEKVKENNEKNDRVQKMVDEIKLIQNKN